jgi:hypothetical protein
MAGVTVTSPCICGSNNHARCEEDRSVSDAFPTVHVQCNDCGRMYEIADYEDWRAWHGGDPTRILLEKAC